MYGMSEVPGVLQGMLLVAKPGLADPNFSRSVLLLLAHGDQGALGLVLNRQTQSPVATALPDWAELASPPATVFAGGPVVEGTICLARLKSEVAVPASGYLALQGALGTVDLDADPAFVGPWIERLRIFAGYAGWGAGQLEDEIAQDAWWVLPPADEDVFAAEPPTLWKAVLRRQGGRLAVVSALPPEPSLN